MEPDLVTTHCHHKGSVMRIWEFADEIAGHFRWFVRVSDQVVIFEASRILIHLDVTTRSVSEDNGKICFDQSLVESCPTGVDGTLDKWARDDDDDWSKELRWKSQVLNSSSRCGADS